VTWSCEEGEDGQRVKVLPVPSDKLDEVTVTQDPLDVDFGPLRSTTDDLLNSRRNPFISFQPARIAVVGFVTRQGIGLGGGFAQGQGLCERYCRRHPAGCR
jgi:hypothetical protein